MGVAKTSYAAKATGEIADEARAALRAVTQSIANSMLMAMTKEGNKQGVGNALYSNGKALAEIRAVVEAKVFETLLAGTHIALDKAEG